MDRVVVDRGDERAGLLERTARGARFSYGADFVEDGVRGRFPHEIGFPERKTAHLARTVARRYADLA